MTKTKNPHAAALGRMGRGIKKTGLLPAEIQRRRDLALRNSAMIAERTRAKRLQTLVESGVENK